MLSGRVPRRPLRALLASPALERVLARVLTALLIALCAFLLVRQVATLSFPILGEHGWRQSDVYSVAYNFAHEGADFFHPRIDWNNGRSGIMGMEPPILPYLIAAAMRVFGDDDAVARWVAWSLCMLGLAGFAYGLLRERGALFAALTVLCVLLSPLGLFELRQIQPDGPMTMIAAAAAVLFVRAARSERVRDYAVALAVYCVAVLLKGPAIVLAPAMLLFAIAARPVPWRVLLLRALPLIVPCALLAAWFHWSALLNEEFSPRRVYFAMAPKPGEMLANIVDGNAAGHVFLNLYPHYVLSSWLLPATALGGVVAFTREHRCTSVAFLAWLACVSLFLAAFSSRLYAHWYYADLALPPLAYFTALGLWWPLCSLLAPALPPRARYPRYALALLALLAPPFAARSALATLAARSAASEVADHRALVLEPLRAAVARFTTRADLIAINGRDPFYLHLALRKGFTMSARAIASHHLAYFARRGALIYVHLGVSRDLPAEIRAEDPRYPLLFRGKGFRIYCLQSSCPERSAQPNVAPSGA